MSGPFLERLNRFTPDAGRIDRDALLFATGRASARPNRGWITLAALLAGTQALSLVLLLPHAQPPGASSPLGVAVAPSVVAEPPAALANPGLLLTRHGLESEPDDRPETGTFIESGPPLRAFGSPPSSIMN